MRKHPDALEVKIQGPSEFRQLIQVHGYQKIRHVSFLMVSTAIISPTWINNSPKQFLFMLITIPAGDLRRRGLFMCNRP
jgi:hypothetical protein